MEGGVASHPAESLTSPGREVARTRRLPLRRLLLLLVLGLAAMSAPQAERPVPTMTAQTKETIPPADWWWRSAAFKVGAPANQPWAGLLSLGLIDRVYLERLAREDPIAFLEICMLRYQLAVHG